MTNYLSCSIMLTCSAGKLKDNWSSSMTSSSPISVNIEKIMWQVITWSRSWSDQPDRKIIQVWRHQCWFVCPVLYESSSWWASKLGKIRRFVWFGYKEMHPEWTWRLSSRTIPGFRQPRMRRGGQGNTYPRFRAWHWSGLRGCSRLEYHQLGRPFQNLLDKLSNWIRSELLLEANQSRSLTALYHCGRHSLLSRLLDWILC